jgi:hypothetical protein
MQGLALANFLAFPASLTCPLTSLPLQNSNVGGYNSRGFVEVLAASQTTTTKEWFQGTADAVRQYMWLFDEACRDGVEDFLILSGVPAVTLSACKALLLWVNRVQRRADASLAGQLELFGSRVVCGWGTRDVRRLHALQCRNNSSSCFLARVVLPAVAVAANLLLPFLPYLTVPPAGDHLYRMDYREFVEAHRAAGADITVAALPCAEREATAFGLMKIDDGGRIVEFAEKPSGDALKAMQVDTTILGLDAET